ncbi:hypothetical protein C5167_019098 [Papaver somniferum]|uniref:Uncharacterized protein n=1 Tax=Papaver somniferum TaxID=3469 RepID=A0A4Y7IP75_PAPSO|nr:uncharacterized protein LOC113348568 [Papaver somniferum]RZC50673.1 hypothetical protein C5167_019098 [Papaver somniferum]
MKKKAGGLLSGRNVLSLGSKIVITLSAILCVYSLLRIHSQSKKYSSSSTRRSYSLVDEPFQGSPKIAFLFLTRRNLPLDFLWETFFQNADVGNFSIYVHSEPGYVFDESTTRSPIFYGRQLKKSIQVVWGESSMIEAERLLFGEALQDPANQRFVLLSDSCVPLYNFSHIYNYMMSSSKSFVDSFLDAKEGRYNPKMSPNIPKGKWRKGSQWIALVRKHAKVIVNDDFVLPVFKRYCKRRPPMDFGRGKQNLKFQTQHNCIPDEHYVQTLLAMSDLEGELERRTLTYTFWNESKTETDRKAWHPFTFGYADAGTQQINEIKVINHVNYDSEYRVEWCKSNSTLVNCFIFARKFSRGAAMRLLSEGIVGNFKDTAMLDTPF